MTHRFIGVILSGSPFSVYDEKAFKIDIEKIRGRYPILGICYGAQLMAMAGGGKVEPADSRESDAPFSRRLMRPTRSCTASSRAARCG